MHARSRSVRSTTPAGLPPGLFHVLAAAVLALAAALFAPPVSAQPAAAVSAIRIDVSPLRQNGVGKYADLLQAALGDALAARFADRRAQGGARLTVVLESFELRGYGSGESDDAFGMSSTLSADELAGYAVLEAGGRVIAREPLRVSLPPGQTGPWNAADFEQRRAVALAEAYASWLARRL